MYALSMFHCVNDGSLALFASALPVMRLSLELSFVEIGTILSLGLVGTMLLQLVFGSLSDIGHADRVLVVGFAGIVAVDLAFPTSSTFIQVLVFYVLLRCAAAVYHPVSFASIGRTYVQNKSAAFGFQGAIGDIGLTLATFSTGLLSEIWGWKIPFWTWGAIGLALFVHFAGMIMRHPIVPQRQPATPPHEINEAPQRNSRSIKSVFAVLATVSSLSTTTFILFTGYMPLYFNLVAGLSPSLSTALVGTWIGVGALAGFMTGRIVSRLHGEIRTLRATFAVDALLLLLAYATAGFRFPSPWAGVSYLAVVLTGIPVFITFPAVNGLLGLRMPHKRLGLTYALNLSLGLMVASFATYVMGYLASVMSIAVALPMMLTIAILGAAASLLL